MGALDFLKEFEGRALDAASYRLLQRNYEMQEENNRLLKEKTELLEAQVADLSTKVEKLTSENAALERKLASTAAEEEYKVLKDAYALKRGSDGLYEENAYCPNCHIVMGTMGPRTYQCAKCKHIARVKLLACAAAQNLNEKQQT